VTPLALVLADESKKSGPIGLVVILVLCVACYFLFKSMSRHMRKVREEFPVDATAGRPEGAPAESAATPATPTDPPATPTDAAAPPAPPVEPGTDAPTSA